MRKSINWYVGNFIANKLTGNIINKLFNGNIPVVKKFSLFLNYPFVSKKFIANIFFGIHEAKEIRFLKSCLNPLLPVVEFGSSLGVTTLNIASISKERIITVEANPYLAEMLQKNIFKNKLENRLKLINAAVDYSGESLVFFTLDKGLLGSSLSTDTNKEENPLEIISVQTIQLSEIITDEIKEYALVCDIEGAEYGLFYNETNKKIISKCKQIIIELHRININDKIIIPAELALMIENLWSIKLKASKNDVYFFERD